MKKLAVILFIAASPLLFAQVPDGDFEQPPTLSARAIIKPEFLSGEHFSVQDAVPTYGGRNDYTVDSDYGIFVAKWEWTACPASPGGQGHHPIKGSVTDLRI